jgi:hypothetical protein
VVFEWDFSKFAGKRPDKKKMLWIKPTKYNYYRGVYPFKTEKIDTAIEIKLISMVFCGIFHNR